MVSLACVSNVRVGPRYLRRIVVLRILVVVKPPGRSPLAARSVIHYAASYGADADGPSRAARAGDRGDGCGLGPGRGIGAPGHGRREPGGGQVARVHDVHDDPRTPAHQGPARPAPRGQDRLLPPGPYARRVRRPPRAG